MPNWCENELTIQGGSGVLACLDAIQGDAGEKGPCHIDFQRIVPMPAILEGTSSPVDKRGLVLLGDDAEGREMLSYPWVRQERIANLDALRSYLRENCPEAEEHARRSIQAEQETGYRDWYERRIGRCESGFGDGHWGTKWNACCSELLDGTTDSHAVVAFSTAWTPPSPVVLQLSKRFPKLTFTLKYWEGRAGFCGTMRARAGKILRDVSRQYRGPRGG